MLLPHHPTGLGCGGIGERQGQDSEQILVGAQPPVAPVAARPLRPRHAGPLLYFDDPAEPADDLSAVLTWPISGYINGLLRAKSPEGGVRHSWGTHRAELRLDFGP